MCELILVNVKDIGLSRILTASLIMQDSSKNLDGTGFFVPDSPIFKTNLAGNNIGDLGVWINRDVKKISPIIAHVRNASVAFKNKIIRDHAHPFETDKLVLAHNGTLVRDIWQKEDPELMDSQIFLKELDKIYDGTNLPDALKNAYKLFNGKFAFLIYSKIEKRFFAARGETATLFSANLIRNGEIIGYAVNTEKDDLHFGCLKATNCLQTVSKSDYRFTAPVEVEKESIYLVEDSGLVKIGEIKETKREYYNYQDYGEDFYGRGNYSKSDPLDKGDSLTEVFQNIRDIGLTLNLTLGDVDKILFATRNTGIIGATEEDYRFLLDVLFTEFSRILLKFPKYPVIATEMRKVNKDFYQDFKLQFPYILNDYKKFKSKTSDTIRDSKLFEIDD